MSAELPTWAPIHRHYAANPHLLANVLGLLDAVFGNIVARVNAAKRLGLRWNAVSEPFIAGNGYGGANERLFSHVGVLQIPAIVDDEFLTMAGIHGVATRPAHRHKGHARAAMDAALAWADEQGFHTQILTTAIPDFFAKFGFRRIEEYFFVGDRPPATGAEIAPGDVQMFRPLDFANRADIKILRDALANREPVSDRLGILNESAVFAFNAAFATLHVAPDLEAIVWYEIDGATLKIFDVVARVVPPLAEIIARIPAGHFRRIELYLPADRLAPDFAAIPLADESAGTLMVRGPFPTTPAPLILPYSTRC